MTIGFRVPALSLSCPEPLRCEVFGCDQVVQRLKGNSIPKRMILALAGACEDMVIRTQSGMPRLSQINERMLLAPLGAPWPARAGRRSRIPAQLSPDPSPVGGRLNPSRGVLSCCMAASPLAARPRATRLSA